MEDIPSEHFSNRFVIPPANGPAYVDKETLKQNVLAHEATFREQVSELHRLYKVQKNLMAVQCREEELNVHSQGRSYPSPSGGIRKAQQVGKGMKKPSENFMKGKNSACSSNGVSLRSTKRMLDIQVPADACAYDSDDDMAMMWENPANGLPINNGSVLGTNLGSKSVAANEETRHSNSYSQKKDDGSNGMNWSAHNKNGVDSSTAHYLSNSSISNPQVFAASSSNAALKSQWRSSSTGYTARMHYADGEMQLSQNNRLPSFQEYRGLHSSEIPGGGQYQKHSPLYDCPNDVNLNSGPPDATTTLGQASESTPMEISWVRNKLLSMAKEVSTKKSQVPSSCGNGHSEVLPGSMVYSEGSTRIFGCTVSAATERDSQPSSTAHMGTDITPLIEGANMQIQCRSKKDDSNVRNLIDLNVALPCMDDMEIDARQSEGNTVPQEPDVPFIDLNVAVPYMDDMEIGAHQLEGNTVPREPADPSNEALAITAAKNLMVMHKDGIQAGSSQVNDILHWFADLAISGENAVVYNSESNNDDNSEALTPRQFETKDRVTAHRSQPKTIRRRKTRSAAASTFKASYKANSSTATPPEDRYPEGHHSGTQNSKRRSSTATPPEDRYPEGHCSGTQDSIRRSLRNVSYKANSSAAMPPEGHYSVTLNARQRSLRSFRGKK